MFFTIRDLQVPTMFYGTAWKEEKTQALTEMALENGFLGIDTANQRKHYYEEGVGLALQSFLKTHSKKRESLFIQTKYTYPRGQDHRKPYDETQGFAIQLKQSFESSLKHLGTDYLDSYVLHGPYGAPALSPYDWEVWAEMEKLQAAGKTRLIGVSNVDLLQLEELFERAEQKPSFVQNRCYAVMGWDKDVRQFCKRNNILYQGFSLLTANRSACLAPFILALSKKYACTPAQIVFRFSQQMQMIVLTGTSNAAHMREDLNLSFELTKEELGQIENIAS